MSFRGGVPDMRAIRDYLKFLYDRAPVSEIPRYLLLFGDGHYDFRGLSTYNNPLNNLIFPYETEESLRSDASFTSDDYFGLLDDNEGLWGIQFIQYDFDGADGYRDWSIPRSDGRRS